VTSTEVISARTKDGQIMPGIIAIKLIVFDFRQYSLLACLLFAGGCSWKTPTPSDYVPPEEPGEAWIIAIPNPVPAGRGPGKTIVTWYTGDGSPGQVYVSIGGAPEQLFSTNPSHHEATINGKSDYEFRLYAGADHTTRLGTVKVTRDQPLKGQLAPDRDRVRRRTSL
jgi:hypothetical protein